MEQERIAREQEEKEKAEKMKKIKEQFGDTNSQWEKDKTEMQNIALKDKQSKGDKASTETKKDTTGESPDQGVKAEAGKAAEKKVGGGSAKAPPKEES
jgi:mannan polymerase II complex ANP1 subunit